MNQDESQRPWGFYENLTDAENHKVKRITVYPGKRLSLQSHEKRAEHWYIVQGTACFTLDENETTVSQGQAVDIGLGAKHRIENTGNMDLVFIEIQTGNYFGEDDIIRYEDDFGRS